MARSKTRRTARAIALPRITVRAHHLWILGGGALVGLAALNATLLQPGAHPAPLFAPKDALPPAALSVRAGPIPDPHVRELQSRLQAMGFYTGALDGLMGRQTLSAVYEALDDPSNAAEQNVALTPRDRALPPAPVRNVGQETVSDAANGLRDDPLAELLGDAATGDKADETTASVSRDAVVRLVQERLAERGYDPGPVDGMIGSATRAALASFQRAEGLADSGTINTETLDALGLGDAVRSS